MTAEVMHRIDEAVARIANGDYGGRFGRRSAC
jgi:hypothetical protein